MATLALSLAGQFAGGIVGGPFGATLGRALGALAGSVIDGAIFGEEQQQTLPAPFALQGSSEGGVIPRIYGWNRVTGNIIWATNLERQSIQNTGSKGMSDAPDEQIVANFAVGLCEGEVAHLGRIWADGRLLETQGLNFRFYSGDQSQTADSLIVAKQGVQNTPAYRGLCYLVFEGLPLTEFGNRIPNISVELCRVVGDLEPSIKAITVIPGSTEFGYDPVPRVRIVSPGKTVSENANQLGQTSDWSISIDELQALCPNLKHVALVVAWFGDDLRCGQCKIQPRVEVSTKNIPDTSWVVSGNTRAQVPLMTQYEGGPAYGGTPSDNSVLAAIADLKSRGFKVTLYPFVMMDIAHGNGLTDPYTGTVGQSAYPWRGRITCAPAPGQPGSPDGTGALDAQVSTFTGSATVADFSNGSDTINYSGPEEWGYRRMILHYAKLAQLAGGIDAMLIGSELRGLTWLRNGPTSFPFVDDLIELAADVRGIVGPSTKLSYGADWSEYAGLQPPDAPGDKIFHLDALWASSAIDAVGIDNYMPLSDWRGVEEEPDAAVAKHPYQLDYLQANIAGGEGFDWYYASDADRENAIRTPITDGVGGEPWVWRLKDIKNWWSNAHHNRVGGVRDAVATPWVPQSKPIWFTELGCGAVDKGANQPNVFGDAKSAENARPYFSSGVADPHIQRQFLRAHHQWWQAGSPGFDPGNNPDSSQYAGQMLDPERIYVWTWDARPYPAFPNRTDVWSDGPNHMNGHWLTGRLGTLASQELIAALGKDFGVSFSRISAAAPLAQGVQLNSIISLRRAVEPYLQASAMNVRDGTQGVQILRSIEVDRVAVLSDDFAANKGPNLSRRDPNSDETTGQLALTYIDRASNYQPATVTAIAGLNPVRTGVVTNLVLEGQNARKSVENMLAQKQSATTIEFFLPLSFMSLEVGDTVQISDLGKTRYVISSIRQGNVLKISAHAAPEVNVVSMDADVKLASLRAPQISVLPELFGAHLPGTGGDMEGTQLLVGAFSDPWPGTVSFKNDQDGALLGQLASSSILGILSNPLNPATPDLWDRTSQLHVEIYSGHLSSVGAFDALNGANRIAVLKNNGQCEIVGFENAQLLGPGKYALSGLLRGQNNTMDAAAELADAGNGFAFINGSTAFAPVSNERLDQSIFATAFAGNLDLVGQPVEIMLSHELAKPFAPVHARAKRNGASQDIVITWQRRTQIGGDSWAGSDVPLDFSPEAYVLSIFDGATLVRQIDCSAAQYIYSSADQTTDLGAALTPFTFEVRQVSAVHGPGAALLGSFSS